MSRRGTARRSARSMSARPRPIYGVGSLDNDTSMVTASPGGIAGVDTGFTIAWFLRPLRSENGTNWSSRRSGTVAGWILRQTSATTILVSAASGAGAFVNSAPYTLAPSIGQETMFHLVHTGAGSELLFYVNGAAAGAASAITGYTPVSAAMTFGGAGGATPQFDFYGCVGGAVVLDAAGVLAHCAAVKAARAIVDLPGGSNMWPARATLAAPTDTIGANNLSFSGSGHTLIANRAPVWGF